MVALGLHARLEPASLLGVANSLEFDSQIPAIGLLQSGDQLAERSRQGAVKSARGAWRIEVGLREGKMADIEQRMPGRWCAERVEIGEETGIDAAEVFPTRSTLVNTCPSSSLRRAPTA